MNRDHPAMVGTQNSGVVFGQAFQYLRMGMAERVLEPVGNDRQGGRLTHVIRVGLECEAPHGNVRFFADVLEDLPEFGEQASLLRLIHRFHGIHNVKSGAVLSSRMAERLHILGETRTSIAGTWEEERRTNATIAPNASTNVIDVCSNHLAEVRDLIHE